MDLSIYSSTEIKDIIGIIDTDGRRINKDPNKVVGFMSMGGKTARQIEMVTKAIHIVARNYAAYGVTVVVNQVNNDQIRSTFKWSVSEVLDVMLGADFHLVPTHFHQAMVWLAGDTWTIPIINRELDRLYWHLGIPMGKYIHCPVWRQDKVKIYQYMGEFMAPTMHLKLSPEGVSPEDLMKIERFVEEINMNPRYSNENRFVVKLNHTTGSAYNSTVKTATGGINGKRGILKRIQEFRNNKKVIGFFETLLIQPLIKHNTENKSICFNGEHFGCNIPRKVGNHGNSFFPLPGHASFDVYAEQMITKFKAVCPSLIADQLLRIDHFCEDPLDVGSDMSTFNYLLNEVEGHEAQNVCHRFDEVQARIANHWVQDINQLVKCHLRRIDHPLSKFFDNSEEFDFMINKTN